MDEWGDEEDWESMEDDEWEELEEEEGWEDVDDDEWEDDEDEDGLVVTCTCGEDIEIPDDFTGSKFRCPNCGRKGRIPGR